MSFFRDRIDFSRGIRIQYQVREQATPSTSRGIIPTALAKAFCGQKPTPTLPIIHFFQTDLSSKQLWFIDLIQASDCRARTSPNLPCVAKFYEDRITIPPDDLNAALGRNRRLWARIDRRIFNEKLMLFWCYDRQKKDDFKPFERLIITNFRTVERRFSDTRKARKRPVFRHLRTFSRWQGQNGSNARHAVLEAMLNFLSRSNFSPFLGICCQPRHWCFKNWCFFDDMN